MGIFINLSIIPGRIPAEEWRRVYQESLRLVEAYDFMDKVEGERNGLSYVYAEKSRDRENLWGKCCHGWHSVGDMRTGFNTEDYMLYEDIHAYLPQTRAEDNGADILLNRLYYMDDIEKPGGCINIWGNKTQGEDSHIYLLAIGCLIADRFPDAAMVSGDISVGQCRRAVRWANQYLEKPVFLPHTGQREKLLQRLRRTDVPEERLLEAFLFLTDEAKDARMGEFLQREFDRKAWYQYYRSQFGRYQIDQRGYFRILKEYLVMGFDFGGLCRMTVKDPEGMRADPEKFLERVLESRLHVAEKETCDLTWTAREKADQEEADTIRGLFAGFMGTLCGAENRNVAAFYPLERIREDCRSAFGDLCDVDAVIDRALEADRSKKDSDQSVKGMNKDSLQNLLYDDPESLLYKEAERLERKRREEEKYDIRSYQELIDFVPGCRVRPELEEDLIRNFQLLHRSALDGFEKFQTFNEEERENYFIRKNRNVLLRKEVWERIFDSVMEDAYIIRFYGLFQVDCTQRAGYIFCKNLTANLQVIDYYWEKTL